MKLFIETEEYIQMSRLSESQRNEELKRLVHEQEDDMSTQILYPETITPLKLKILECLSPKEKASVLLSAIGKMSNIEIGEAMGCRESSVRGFMKRGYRKLRGVHAS